MGDGGGIAVVGRGHHAVTASAVTTWLDNNQPMNRIAVITGARTASYVLPISTVTRTLQMDQRLTGMIAYDEGRFPIEITSDPVDAFIEFDPPNARRAWPNPARLHPIGLDCADLWWAALVVRVPADRPEDHKALPAERRMAFLEPPVCGTRSALVEVDLVQRFRISAAMDHAVVSIW